MAGRRTIRAGPSSVSHNLAIHRRKLLLWYMGQRKRWSGAMCVYCNAARATTSDHIPPRALSPKAAEERITVPSCYRCNATASDDDSYLRDAIVLRADVAQSGLANEAIGNMRRSLARARPHVRVKRMAQTLQSTAVRDARGRIISAKITYEADAAIVRRCIQRIVRGLHYHVSRVRLRDDYAVRVLDWQDLTPYELSFVAQTVGRKQLMPVTGGVFEYAHDSSPDDANMRTWILQFYRCARFVVATGPSPR
jgi:hypothetical protein